MSILGMGIFQFLVMAIWTGIGLFRYMEWKDEHGRGVDPDLYGVHWYTILVHGPFWWLVKIGVVVRDFLSKQDWSWFERLFTIKKKGDK